MVNQPPMRYAHSEGHIDITYDGDGDHLITAGSDGDVRVYKGFEDDDPVSYRVGENVVSVAVREDKFLVGADDNAIRSMNISDGELDGIITRFTAPVTHIDVRETNNQLVAGSCDFTVKLVELKSNKQVTLQEHGAPVLSVALHPSGHYVASSSCDGLVKVFDLNKNEVIKEIDGLPKCNDFLSSTSLSRLCWDKHGKMLLVPINREIKAYQIADWSCAFTLSDDAIGDVLSIVALSQCGQFVAGGCRDGGILIWSLATKKCIVREKHGKSLAIAALKWNPKSNGEIAYADVEGQLGVLENIDMNIETTAFSKASEPAVSDLFDDDDDEVLANAADTREHLDDDELITRKKNKQLVLDDDNSRDFDLGRIKSETMGEFMDDDASEVSDAPALKPTSIAPASLPVAKSFEPTHRQKPFQSSSTPVHLSNRFMVWNRVGVMTQYDTDEEQSISIEFHDTATHHSLHVPNGSNFTIADLSAEAAVLACACEGDEPSKLSCMHFASWDSNKEWTTDMPEGEEITNVCLGEGWLAVGTDQRMIRIFSISGVQKECFCMPGPLVSLAGYGNQLLITYHRAMGIPGDQCLGVQLLQVTRQKRAIIKGDDLPLSPRSTLSWIGFTAEGTATYVDSMGIVRFLNRSFNTSWVQICNMKSLCKGKSDNYWVVSMHENPEQIRGILCKGSKFPPTLPKPNVAVLPFKLPLCEMGTEKGIHEEALWRGTLTSLHFDWWDSQGYEVDEFSREQKCVPQKETLMKLFALACKTDHEYRAVEISELMPDAHTVQLAIKYASRLRRMQLAEKLTEVAREKVEEESAVCFDNANDYSSNGRDATSVERANMNMPDVDDAANGIKAEENDEIASKDSMVLLKPTREKIVMPRSLTNSQKGNKNPFKVSSKNPDGSIKGSSVFDTMEKVKEKTSSSTLAIKTTGDNKSKKKIQSATQGKLFPSSKKSTLSSERSPFQCWYEAHKDDLKEEFADVSDSDLTIEAAKRFKSLPKEEQKEWQTSDSNAESKKRKRSPTGDDLENMEMPIKREAPKKRVLSQSTSSKLAGFSFSKN